MRRIALIVLLAFLPSLLPAQDTWTDARKQEMANKVRQEFLFAWNGYKTHAWGHDELRPISRTARDWYGPSLLMTPVDALDTMTLMGLDDEAATTRDYSARNVN